MANLAVGDLTIPQLLLDYILAQSTYRSAFVGSGAAIIDSAPIAGAGGNVWTARDVAPYGTRAVPADGTGATGVAHTPRAYNAPIVRRRYFFNMKDEIKAALGAQNAALLQALIQADLAELFPREFDASLIDICKAVFDTSAGVLRSSNSYSNIAASSGAADQPFTLAGYLAARLKLGDNADKVAALVVHSKVEADMVAAEAQRITYQALTGPDGQRVDATYYMGKRLIVSDNVPTATVNGHTVYSSYLVGIGTFMLGVQSGPEIVSDKPADTMIDRISYKMAYGHGMKGVNWTGTPASADSGATSTEVQTATNWTKVAATKEIPIVEYRSN